MSETDHDAMVRWQGYAREHRSAVNSLFLTYAAALFGLQCSILLSKDVERVYWSTLFILAAILALVSLIAGGVVVVVRLHDARLTARIVRLRIEKESKAEKKSKAEVDSLQAEIDALQTKIEEFRESTNNLGWWTNILIPVQFTAFAVAAVTFLVWVLLSFRTKLV